MDWNQRAFDIGPAWLQETANRENQEFRAAAVLRTSLRNGGVIRYEVNGSGAYGVIRTRTAVVRSIVGHRKRGEATHSLEPNRDWSIAGKLRIMDQLTKLQVWRRPLQYGSARVNPK
jgi:hypothetical protein